MKKFLWKMTLLVGLLAMFGIVAFSLDYYIIGNQYEDDYDASLIDKVARVESINEPKIILIGNSNLAFGIDSEMIEDAVGMPVVNMGLHGGLGNAFHENMAKLNLRKGDIVIICHSSFSDDDTISDSLLAWTTVEYRRELWKLVRKKDYYEMALALPTYILNAYTKKLISFVHRKNTMEINTCYSRYAFNEYGDVMFKPKEGAAQTSDLFQEGSISVPEINDICVNRLNRLNAYVKGKGAVLLVAGYPIAEGEFTPPKGDYVAFQQELKERLDCDVISDYTDYFIPYRYFYDTILHLNEEGARMRTEQLIEDVLEELQ